MKDRKAGSICWVLGLVLLSAWQADAQSRDEKTVIEIKQPETKKGEEAPPPMIGMEAYREVLASGRYLVSAGDEFLVYVTGMEKPFTAEVLAEGSVFIPQVGTIKVGGLRLREARQAVVAAFRSTVRVGEIVFELSVPRSFPVPVVGMVESPGVKAGSGVERVSEILLKAGELLPTASRRNIQLMRTFSLDEQERHRVRTLAVAGRSQMLGETEVRRVDLVLHQTTGESHYNPFIEDGDIILVPPKAGDIAVLGAVQRPAFYEYVEGDRLSSLLTLGMGPNARCDWSKAFLFRFAEDKVTRQTMPVDLEGVLAEDSEADLLLRPDDWLVLREIAGFHQESEVRVAGEVRYPGYYVVGDGTTLREIIEKAGGFTKNASLAEASVTRMGFVEEEEEDPEFERIRFVPVSERTEMDNQYFIMKSREKRGQMSVDFVDLFEGGDAAQNIELMPGDMIIVPALRQTVMVSGQVTQPGAVIYDPEYTVWDYIDRAGGFGWRASKDVLVIKAGTGDRKRARDVAQIQPGDRIWVREKPVRDYWAIFTQTMGVIGQVTTVILLYVTLTN